MVDFITTEIEIYENEVRRNSKWINYSWNFKKTNLVCASIEDIMLPSLDWEWISNWKIMKGPGVCDNQGQHLD